MWVLLAGGEVMGSWLRLTAAVDEAAAVRKVTVRVLEEAKARGKEVVRCVIDVIKPTQRRIGQSNSS